SRTSSGFVLSILSLSLSKRSGQSAPAHSAATTKSESQISVDQSPASRIGGVLTTVLSGAATFFCGCEPSSESNDEIRSGYCASRPVTVSHNGGRPAEAAL